jgi:membrane protease YdiL (CAAX protease family)
MSADPKSETSWLRPELVASWWEIALVTAAFVGPFALKSTTAALGGSAAHYVDLLLNNTRLVRDGAFEGLLLAGFLFYLSRRGWTVPDFRIRPGVRASVSGFGLFLVTEVLHFVTVVGLFLLLYALQSHARSFAAYVFTQVPHLKPHSIDLNWAVIVGTMILNAYFEELVCMGYFFTQVAARCGPLVALILTVFLRMACHTYQGPVNVIGIGLLFLVYGLWYWRSRNLWPLIFAHAVLDLFSTSAVKLLYGH